MSELHVDTIDAPGGNVVVAQTVGDVIFQQSERSPRDFVLPFDLDAEAEGFVGRDAVFAKLAAFVGDHPCGYYEIVGEAGLGKTALAAEVARRQDAIAYFASAHRGTQSTSGFLAHVSAELLLRYELGLKSLPASAEASAVVLIRLMRQAVERTSPVWIVVDGLDEADAPPPGANPLLLPPELPAGVFVVVTRRTGTLLVGPRTAVGRHELTRDSAEQIADIDALVRARVAADEHLTAMVSGPGATMSLDDLARALTARSDGNFLYLSLVLADIAASGPVGIDLDRLPDKLAGYYEAFWSRLADAQNADWETWDRLHQPVLERLAVAAEPVSEAWLAAQVGRSATEIAARVLAPWRRVLSPVSRDRLRTWRVVHRSFPDYLVSEGRVDLAHAHRAVASSYVDGRIEWDGYGLRHAAAHLAAAADASSGAPRDAAIAALAQVVVDEPLVRRRLQAGDLAQVERDLRRARDLVAGSEVPGADLLLVSISLLLLRLRHGLARPDAIFDAAARGAVGAAQQLLDLFAADLAPEWHAALTLEIAWLARDAAPADALALERSVREDVSKRDSESVVLERLLARMGDAPAGAPSVGPPLPEAPGEAEARMIIERLAGTGMYASLRFDKAQLDESGGYMSAIDGPPLVALAQADPAVGEPLLERYVDLHGAYGYLQYRSASLWRLLPSILAHGDPAWMRQVLARTGSALLAPARGEFLEGLEVAALTLQARAGERAAADELEQRRARAKALAAVLPPGSGTARIGSGEGSEGDVWGLHRRRLAALAESAAVLSLDSAKVLVDAAGKIAGGYAGFTAVAYLTLAETASIAGADRGEVDWVRWSLSYAMRAAQNVRDPVHCARTTARVAAMRARWWPEPPAAELAGIVARLQADPSAGEFAAQHVVGGQLTLRQIDDLPAGLQAAATLRDLAKVYDRPLADFVAVNDGLDPGAQLADGQAITVPDPGFPPLVAARLSAAVLSHGSDEALIRRLVPVASGDTAALTTTLSRLLLATGIDDPAQRARLDSLLTTSLRANLTARPDPHQEPSEMS